MIQHRLRQFGDTLRRLLKVTTLAEHEAVLQRIESLSSQMNALSSTHPVRSGCRSRDDLAVGL